MLVLSTKLIGLASVPLLSSPSPVSTLSASIKIYKLTECTWTQKSKIGYVIDWKRLMSLK